VYQRMILADKGYGGLLQRMMQRCWDRPWMVMMLGRSIFASTERTLEKEKQSVLLLLRA